MLRCSKAILTAAAVTLGLGVSPSVRADIAVQGSFGPNGDVGFVNSPPTLSITFGATGNGSVYQMDGFVNASNANFVNNPDNFGTSAQLTYGAPTGLAYGFAATQPTSHELLLTYTFTNNTGMALTDFQFMHFVDGDIGTNFADEWTSTSGTLSGGFRTPSSFQVGDPSTSTLFKNLLLGTLSNGNDFPNSTTAGDVAIGLGLSAGTLAINKQAVFQILLSDDGTALPGFSITQHDPLNTGDTLTVSGAVVPEPSSLVLAGLVVVGSIAVNRSRVRKQAARETNVEAARKK